MTEKLKPCPFCGGEGHESWLNNGKYRIVCTSCFSVTGYVPEKEEARKIWNTRSPLPDTNVEKKWNKYPEVKPEKAGRYLCVEHPFMVSLGYWCSDEWTDNHFHGINVDMWHELPEPPAPPEEETT